MSAQNNPPPICSKANFSVRPIFQHYPKTRPNWCAYFPSPKTSKLFSWKQKTNNCRIKSKDYRKKFAIFRPIKFICSKSMKTMWMYSIATIVIKTYPIIILKQRKILFQGNLAVNATNQPKRGRKGLCLAKNIRLNIMKLWLIWEDLSSFKRITRTWLGIVWWWSTR